MKVENCTFNVSPDIAVRTAARAWLRAKRRVNAAVERGEDASELNDQLAKWEAVLEEAVRADTGRPFVEGIDV